MSINVVEDQRLVSVASHNSPTNTGPSNALDYSWTAEPTLYQQLGLSYLDDDEVLALMDLSPVERKHQGVFFPLQNWQSIQKRSLVTLWTTVRYSIQPVDQEIYL